MAKNIEIYPMLPNHWKDVARIYEQGIQTGFATFEKEIPTWEKWNEAHLERCRLVAKYPKEILGWAALSPVSSRCVYGGVAEVSIYIAANQRGKNIGNILLQELIVESEKNNLWTLQSGIFPENIGSIKLHENHGFRQIGFREKVGKLDGVWKDNVLFERRSKTIGID
jgi:L-amino acid N-acyltransferase YncA